MIRTFYRCNLKYAGLLSDAAQVPIVVDVEGFDVASVTLYPTNGTFATAAVAVQWSNASGGPFVDFSTAVPLSNATRGSGLVGVVGKYLVVYVTTGEGSDSYVDVVVVARRSEIPTEVTV